MFRLLHKLRGKHLWEPPSEVVHENSCNESLAQAGRQAHQSVLQQSCPYDVHLVPPLWDCSRIYPVLGIGPASRVTYLYTNQNWTVLL